MCIRDRDKVRRSINRDGVVDANSVIFSFLLPSLFAACFAAILTAVNEHSVFTIIADLGALGTGINYGPQQEPGRSSIQQGGYLILGWVISACLGLIAGGIIGLLYLVLDTREKPEDFFSDLVVFDP